MKKKLPLGVLVLGLVLAAGCAAPEKKEVTSAGKVDDTALDQPAGETPADIAEATTTTMAPKTSFVVGEIAKTSDGTKIVVRAFDKHVPGEYEPTAETGKEYRVADIEGCAGPAVEGFSLNPFEFELKMADNTRIDATWTMKEPSLGHTELDPGECVRGWVSYEIPVGASGMTLVYEESSFFGGTKIRWVL